MKILIKAARIVDPLAPLNGQVRDVSIENGLIRQIGEGLTADDSTRLIEGENLCVSPGWLDLRVSAGDPGYEHKEDLGTVCRAAARGGFTDIAVLPNTQPALDSKDTLGYIRQATQGQSVTVHAVAAVTRGAKGEEFTEMIDLHHAGAVAFSDGSHPLTDADLLVKTLLYLQPFDGLLMNRPQEPGLSRFGQMNEGIPSTRLGMKGLPALAEDLMVERDLRLLEYALGATGTVAYVPAPALHFSTLSTAGAVELIRQAKNAGLPVSCDIAAHQLAFTDADLMAFDTNLKVSPPFRSAQDVAALREGLRDGTIDAVVSDHQPQDSESKNVEFDQAEFGIIGLETAFSVLTMYAGGLTAEQCVDKLAHQPRRILRLPQLTVDEQQPATLTVYDPEREWVYSRTASKSKNSPFLGATLRGKALWIINRGLAEHVDA